MRFELTNRNIEHPYKYVGDYAAEQWAKIGLHVSQKTLKTDLYYDVMRNGDFDERLVRDSQRSAILVLFETAKSMIWTLRNDRSRMSLYEHLEWLHRRWQARPPRRRQIIWEALLGRPFSGSRHNPHD